MAVVCQAVEGGYDPQSPTDITIEAPGQEPWTAHPLVIGEHAGRRPALPDQFGETPVTESRVLRAAEARARSQDRDSEPVISYRAWVDDGGTPHV